MGSAYAHNSKKEGLTVIQITLEDDEVGFGEMLEEIRSFRMEIPLRFCEYSAQVGLHIETYECIAGAPERVC